MRKTVRRNDGNNRTRGAKYELGAPDSLRQEHPPARAQRRRTARAGRDQDAAAPSLFPKSEARLTVAANNNTHAQPSDSAIHPAPLPSAPHPRNGSDPQRAAAFIQDLAGRKIVILGLARQGSALARFFVAAGARVTISDLASADKLQAEVANLADLPVEFVLGSHPLSLLDDCALLCLSGGVPPQNPFVQAARSRGIPLSNDSLLTFQLARALGLGPIIGITGSSGKTTTTTLVGKILAAQGLTMHVGGNIGTPLLDRLETVAPQQPLVLELSSFQLELFDPTLAWWPIPAAMPTAATITNLTPNHLDRHPSMAAYAAAKLNLLCLMGPGSTLVVNVDDPVTARLAPPQSGDKRRKLPSEWKLEDMLAETRATLETNGVRIIPVSRQHQLEQGAWLEGDTLVYDGQPICRRSEIQLRGDHNISNLLVAGALAHAVGAELPAMRAVARAFHGVAHRLEVVADYNGVTWINDSIATSPERAIAGMRSFDPAQHSIILLAGGKDKNLPWEAFATEAIGRINFLIGFGQSGPMIVRTVQERARFLQQKAPNCAVVQRLEEAVELAGRVAAKNSVVLLSPGGTSFDAYNDFEERGEHFRQLARRAIQQRAISESRVETKPAP